jgi:hypothetical protein
MSRARLLLAAAALLLPLAASAWDPAWFRETNPELDESLRRHDQMIGDIVRAAAADSRADAAAEEAFRALTPAARRELLATEIAAAATRVDYTPVRLAEGPLRTALSAVVLRFTAERATARARPGAPEVELRPGGALPVEFDDVSTLAPRIDTLDLAGRTVVIDLGDVLVRLGPGREPALEGLADQWLRLLSAYNPEGRVISLANQQDTFIAHARRLAERAVVDPLLLQQAGGIPHRPFPYRAQARPFEFHLSLLCMSYGFDGGSGLVWEHLPEGAYRFRRFPLMEDLLSVEPLPLEAESIAADGSSAVLRVNGATRDVRPFDMIPVEPFPGLPGQAIVAAIDPVARRVQVDFAGRRHVYTFLPADLAARIVATEQDPTPAVFFRVLANRAGVPIVVDPSIRDRRLETRAVRAPLGEILRDVCRRHGFSYDWTPDGALRIGAPAVLISPAAP